MSDRILAALDVGGTKADALLFRESGEVIARVVDPAGTPFDQGLELTLENCKNTLEKLFSYANGERIEALYASIATVEYYMEDFRAFFAETFPEVGKIRIEGDGCCLISGMLGHRDGCSMICGTGSSLYMRKGDDYGHIGGGGYLIDSAGSGFCLGRLAIQASLRAVNGGGAPTILTELLNEQGGCEMWDNMVGIYAKGRAYVASFARTVFEARRRGDVVAREIFNTCATDLANVIWGAYSRMGGGFDLVMNGGIVTNFPEYAAAIRALAPPDVNIIFSDVPPVYGCAVEAMYDVGLDCSPAFRERFLEGYRALKP